MDILPQKTQKEPCKNNMLKTGFPTPISTPPELEISTEFNHSMVPKRKISEVADPYLRSVEYRFSVEYESSVEIDEDAADTSKSFDSDSFLVYEYPKASTLEPKINPQLLALHQKVLFTLVIDAGKSQGSFGALATHD